MPFMPAVSLNQRSGALPAGMALRGSSSIGFSFCFRPCSAVQFFGSPQRLLSERELLVGARFKLLSVGAGSKHGDLCNEQIRDSNERSNLSFGGFCSPLPLGTDARRCCQKIHLRD